MLAKKFLLEVVQYLQTFLSRGKKINMDSGSVFDKHF